MNRADFIELIKAALEVDAQAHTVSVEDRSFSYAARIHVLDKDDKLWLIEVKEP